MGAMRDNRLRPGGLTRRQIRAGARLMAPALGRNELRPYKNMKRPWIDFFSILLESSLP